MSTRQWREEGPWGEWEHDKPLGPIVASILAIIAWLVFILFYALFWSTQFDLFQNIIVTIVSLIIVGLLIGLGWVVWGMRYSKRWKKHEQPATSGSQ